MKQIVKELNLYLNGWANYFQIQETKYLFKELDYFVRKRIRSMQLKKWKKPNRFQHFLIQQGWHPTKARTVWVKMNRWKSALRQEVNYALNIKWFRMLGLTFLKDFIYL